MSRLRHRLAASDIAVGDTVTVDFQDTEQQMVVEDVHMDEICGTVTDVDGNDSYQCFKRPEIMNIQKGVGSIQDAGEGTPAEGEGLNGGDNPFQKFLNQRVEYNVLLPGPDGVTKIYPQGSIVKTGFDGIGYYGILRTDNGKEYTIREEGLDKLTTASKKNK